MRWLTAPLVVATGTFSHGLPAIIPAVNDTNKGGIGDGNWRVSDHRRRQLATTLPDRTTPVCRITKLTTRGMML